MPRNGSGVYSLPDGSLATANTTISSSAYNATLSDLASDANTARPISAGGTGATTAADARTALGLGSAALENADEFVAQVGAATGAAVIPRGTTAQRPTGDSDDSLLRWNLTTGRLEFWNGTAWLDVLLNPTLFAAQTATDGAIRLPRGTDAQRPTATADDAFIRYNTTSSKLERWNGTDWKEILSDADLYPSQTGTTGAIRVPRGTTAQQPSATASDAFIRFNSDENAYEVWAVDKWSTVATVTSLGYRNRIVNGGMQISQERGTASVDLTTGSAYVIDQWRAVLSTTPGGTLRGQQIVPAVGSNRIRLTAQVADTSLAAGDFYVLDQAIEGLDLADANFGDGSALPVILRFGARSSIEGTFCVSITNSANARSWIGEFSFAAGQTNTDLVFDFVIPGDVSGTWLRTNGVGAIVRWCFGAGSTFQGVAGWQAGNLLVTSGSTNLMATSGATFELFDVGLYVDVRNAGIVPGWEMPRLDEELRRSMRYWQTVTKHAQGPNGTISVPFLFPVPMRATPSRSNIAAGTLTGATVGVEAGSLNATGFYFQIVSTSITGAVIDRVDAFNARLV